MSDLVLLERRQRALDAGTHSARGPARLSMATYRMTRRSVLIGAVASLICAPAIVRATNLMPVRSLPLQFLDPLGEFYRRCFYHSLDHGLRTGRMIASINGKSISMADARRMVAYARAQGWLPPEPNAGGNRDLARE